MKRAIQANIHDRIFYIDEDAYVLLQNYLHQLSLTFPDEEGQEIVSDIETRVSELFEERRMQGQNVIDITYVNKVIDTVGHPEDLNDEDHQDGAKTPPRYNAQSHETPIKKKLYRDIDDKMIGGVISGIGKYIGLDNTQVTIIRILLVILSVCTYVFPCVIGYLICWLIIPAANTPRRRMEMLGQEVTVDNVGQNVKNDPGLNPKMPSTESFQSVLGTVANVCLKIVMGIVGLCAVTVCILSIIGFLSMIFFLGAFSVASLSEMTYIMGVTITQSTIFQCVWCALVALSILLVSGGIFWLAGSAVFNWKSAKKTTIISSIIILLLALAGVTVLTIYFSNSHIFPIPFVD